MNRAHWDERYAGQELVWTGEANRFLIAEAESLSPGRAIDLACGEGRNAVWLAERGWEVTGVDFSGVGLQKAARLAAARGVRAKWIEADLLNFRPESQRFDLVLMFYLQVPAWQRQPILRGAAAAVGSGGTFLVVAHDSSNLEHGHGGPQNPAVLYTAEDVVADLCDSKLKIERAERVERPVEMPDGRRIAFDAVVRGARPSD